MKRARDYAASHDETDALFEIDVALKFIQQYWPKNKAEEMISNGVISFEFLWAIYPPNVLVVARQVLDDTRVFSVKHHMIFKKRCGTIVRRLTSEYGEYDGKLVGVANIYHQIPKYPGSLPIEQLPFVPLHMHPQRDEIWDSMIARTKKQFSLFQRPFQVQEHDNVGLIQFRDNDFEWLDPEKFKVRRILPTQQLKLT